MLLRRRQGSCPQNSPKQRVGLRGKKLKGGKTRVTLQTSDIVNVATVETKLEETVVYDNSNM